MVQALCTLRVLQFFMFILCKCFHQVDDRIAQLKAIRQYTKPICSVLIRVQTRTEQHGSRTSCVNANSRCFRNTCHTLRGVVDTQRTLRSSSQRPPTKEKTVSSKNLIDARTPPFACKIFVFVAHLLHTVITQAPKLQSTNVEHGPCESPG